VAALPHGPNCRFEIHETIQSDRSAGSPESGHARMTSDRVGFHYRSARDRLTEKATQEAGDATA